MNISVLKYSSVGKFSDPVMAQKELEKRSKKHPDRQYDIIVNLRASSYRYIVAQVRRVIVDMPTEDGLDIPPAPEIPTTGYNSPAWDDYHFEVNKRNRLIDAAQRPAKTLLNQKMNP